MGEEWPVNGQSEGLLANLVWQKDADFLALVQILLLRSFTVECPMLSLIRVPFFGSPNESCHWR